MKISARLWIIHLLSYLSQEGLLTHEANAPFIVNIEGV